MRWIKLIREVLLSVGQQEPALICPPPPLYNDCPLLSHLVWLLFSLLALRNTEEATSSAFIWTILHWWIET